MTVASALNRKTFTGDDATTSFATTPIEFFATSNLKVYVTNDTTNVTTLLTEGAAYTVSGGDEAAGDVGTVNLAGGSSPHGALLSGTTLVIVRELPLLQGVDFVNNEASDAEVAEAALDKLVMNLQRVSERVDRSFVLPDGDVSGASTELPTPSASKLIGWNDDADALVNYAAGDIAPDIVVTAFMETVLDDADAASVRTTLEAAADDAVVKLTGNQTVAGDKTFSGATVFTGQASGFGVPVVKRKTADESVTSSATPQNDDHLSFAVGVDEEWVFELNIDAGERLDTTGVAFNFTAPEGATGSARVIGFQGGVTASFVRGGLTDGLNLVNTSFTVAGDGMLLAVGRVVNGANAGSITLQWAQQTSSETALTFRAGSYLLAHRIA